MTNTHYFGSRPGRRAVLFGLGAMAFGAPVPSLAQSSSTLFRQAAIFGPDAGIVPDIGTDQTAALQKGINLAAGLGQALFLPGGTYQIKSVRLPAHAILTGAGGATLLVSPGTDPMFLAEGQTGIQITNLAISGLGAGPGGSRSGLVFLRDCGQLLLEDLQVRDGNGNGLFLDASAGTVNRCAIANCGKTGLFAFDSEGLSLTNNTISDCGNGGVRVWRDSSGPDGTIITGNRVVRIDWRDGGNGQNGNGVNIFRADGVIVADNVFADCAFSAVRANTTNDTQIRGNMCANSGEVAIFSEFAFTGSLIANNIIDGAAKGISITNFNDGGRLAVCAGNIVRNIAPRSRVNPDTNPAGIAVEADTAVTGNVVDTVPGIGIRAGWGPYLRNVLIANNVVRDTEVAIVVSVAPGAGSATVTGNHLSGATHMALAGMAWDKLVSSDLGTDAAGYPHLRVANNSVIL